MNKKVSKKQTEELLKLAKKVGGSLKDANILGWETTESTAKWIRTLRHHGNSSISS